MLKTFVAVQFSDGVFILLLILLSRFTINGSAMLCTRNNLIKFQMKMLNVLNLKFGIF